MLAGARILLIRLGGLGDVIFTLPAVQAVRAAFPGAKLTFLTYREFVPLLEGFGDLEHVLSVDRAGYKALKPSVLVGETMLLLSHLARSRYELAIDFQGFGETAWMTWWSGAPERWGSVYRPGRSWAYTKPVTRNPALHPIDYNLGLLREAGGLEPAAGEHGFALPEHALRQAEQWFSDHHLNLQQPTLLLHPFTSSPQKNWPLELYLAMARRGQASGLQILFGGGPADRAALEPARAAGFQVAAGASLAVSAGLARLSTLVLGGDSGLPHLAAAMGKRVVMIMRSVQPGACHPFGHRDWAVVPDAGSPVSAVSIGAVWGVCAAALAELGIQLPAGRLAAGRGLAVA